MKALRYTRYGSPDVLRLEDVGTPAPGENDVLIRIRAASLNQYDWHMLTADIILVRFMGPGLFRPKDGRLGADMAGAIEAVGRNVTQFRPGDEVFGMVKGAFAEYTCAPESALVLKPRKLSFEQAAAVPMAALTALQGLRDEARVQTGESVIINGASGGVGTYAVQIAKAFGADVTAVCSPGNLEQARALGADHLIDYTQEDFTRSGRTYDVIFGANGYHPLSDYKRALSPRGRYVMAGGTPAQMFQPMLFGWLLSERGGRRLGGVAAHRNQNDLAVLREMIEAGRIVPAIDRRYPLRQAAEALRDLGEGHARGKVVITMEESA